MLLPSIAMARLFVHALQETLEIELLGPERYAFICIAADLGEYFHMIFSPPRSRPRDIRLSRLSHQKSKKNKLVYELVKSTPYLLV